MTTRFYLCDDITREPTKNCRSYPPEFLQHVIHNQHNKGSLNIEFGESFHHIGETDTHTIQDNDLTMILANGKFTPMPSGIWSFDLNNLC